MRVARHRKSAGRQAVLEDCKRSTGRLPWRTDDRLEAPDVRRLVHRRKDPPVHRGAPEHLTLHSLAVMRPLSWYGRRCIRVARVAAEHSSEQDLQGEDDELNHRRDRKSTRLNSSHLVISYAVFCLQKKKK